jgi:predicted aspartyl protease
MVRAKAGLINANQVRRVRIRGGVDSGATRLVIPGSVARQLGADISGMTKVRYADGRTAQRPMARDVHLTCCGREGLFSAVVEPDRESALIGAIVTEDLDLLVDCVAQRLAPRDPDQIISEVE